MTTTGTKPKKSFRYLSNLWDHGAAARMTEPELLRYRSNLLGADLRITNFGGGNTSSKIEQQDPLTGNNVPVLRVKGSGGDLGSIKESGFATLYLDRVLNLKKRYRGAEHEDEMVAMYPLCTFGQNATAASIDTPLHAFLPYPHIDHLHPDWGIALAACANAKRRLAEFNETYGHRLLWVPWQRPGFELAMMLAEAVAGCPEADGIVLGGHGLFTWGDTHYECYENTLSVIDDLGAFVMKQVNAVGDKVFGGALCEARSDRKEIAAEIMPFLRGRVSGTRRVVGHYADGTDVLQYVNAAQAEALSALGTSCPDHFLRTKICPLFVKWDPAAGDLSSLRAGIDKALDLYRSEYADYFGRHAEPDSPAMRDPNPTVVLIPGVGMFSFGKNKTEARITGEFYTNAIHVMQGATCLGTQEVPDVLPQAGCAKTDAFTVFNNYVALPASEAFRIEYWALEEAKLRRQPPEKEMSRKIAVIVGGANGIGRAVAQKAAALGAHVVVADRNAAAAANVAQEICSTFGKEVALALPVDITRRESIRAMLRTAALHFGGIDIVVNTAAIFPSSPDGHITDDQWRITLDLNVTANYLLADEARRVFVEQGLNGSIVLTSSANAVVPKRGSEAYDVSKAAVSHLVRELAISFAPLVRVNGISPATVVRGSTMFPRDRVIASLTKYKIAFEESATDDDLRSLLSHFYAKRTLTQAAIEPDDCAEAILFLASDRSRCTTGHLVPVDGGLTEAFLR
jgi:rhamnose utilization protein RhaD (predicted bifunctional aldolase and dehydrogenase)/NAD(P)-dependent dehydrogenase (short-subunit alcohol dehydrogenase family)